MSASTSIDLLYVVHGDPPQFVIEFFDRLLDGGWGLEGDVRHLALGDVDDFDWVRTRMTRDESVALVGEKRRRNEQPGLELFTVEGSHGAEFLEVEPGVVSLMPTNDVVALETNRRVADPSWYLQRLLGVVDRMETASLSSIKFGQSL